MRGVHAKSSSCTAIGKGPGGLVTDVQYGAAFSRCRAARRLLRRPEGRLAGNDYRRRQRKDRGATDRNDPAGRLRLLDTNIEVYEDIVPRPHAAEPQAMVRVVTDPPDPLADVVRMLRLDRARSTGTYLDSLRFRFHLARRLGVSPNSVYV